MDNQNSMLGLLGMESTSFLEELSRSDEVTPVAPRGGGVLANGMPQDMASSAAEMQQRIPQQATWGVNQLPHGGGVVHYQNAEYGQYNVAKQQHQRLAAMSGYGSGMMPAGNSGTLQNHPNAAQYGYSGMSGMHSVAVTPPRQIMSGSGGAWNSPGSSGVSSDPLASPSYGGMPGQHGGMVQQHRGSVPPQMQMSANRSNGMQGQMYGQYHDFAAAGAMQQTRMLAYSDSQNQMQEMALSGGYRQRMGSPPPASNRLMQMSGQASQIPSQLHYQQQQQQQQRYPSMNAGMESSHYLADSQPHHGGGGHVISQYQYNPAMMQGQPRMPSEGYSQFYAQPLYRMPSYGAATQAQMMSPNAMAQMSPQARSGGSARPPDIRSPQPSQGAVCSMARPSAVGAGAVAVSVSQSFRPNLSSHTATYTVAANSTAHAGAQRMMLGDSIKAGYPPAMPSAGNPPTQQPMIGNTARYAVPGYQMNTCQNMPSMPAAEMQQQLYSGQQMVDVVDRSHCFPQSHSQGYYQPVTPQHQQQQGQYAASVMMGGLSPGQMAVHKQSQMAQQQQQQQLMSPTQASTSSVSAVCN